MGDKEIEEGAKFLQDSQGNKSSMRLVFFLAFISSVLLAAAAMTGAFLGKDSVVSAGITLVLAFLGVATAGKVGQSFSEKKE